MEIQQLENIIVTHIQQGNGFTKEMRTILLDYKNTGGTQDKVVALLNKLKTENPDNQIIQDGADDILDIATGYCGPSMRVWE
ncbi:hypothetical protein [Aquimarina litoralis]|uniref:hypothetical protein n=1 Tax=Aquimarina litoralis TaxID=584605 RepID=UPI001C598445|nr:hypothetical protein [Aquimarina litoralis]MBW1294171.1 hypothetical protein [Aquimarina litoralis]